MGETPPLIDVEEDDDDDHVRDDIYEDFDELADLAVTSCEPPPPGTRPLQEELLTLITENTVSGVTINKDEVVAWLRNEDALLTGESSHPIYSAESISSESDDSRSPRSSPKKKPRSSEHKSLSSVAVKRRNRTGHRARHSRSPDRDSRRKEKPFHNRGREARNMRPHSVRRSPKCTSAGRFMGSRQHGEHRRLRGDQRPRAHRSPRGVDRSRLPSPRARACNRLPSPRELACSRRVKIQRKVENEENDKNTSKYYHKEVSPKPRPVRELGGIRDAREIIGYRRPPPEMLGLPMTQYVKSLEDQIRQSEIGAKKLLIESRNAKRDLKMYIEEREESSRRRERNKSRDRSREKKPSQEGKRKKESPRNKSHDSRSRKSRSPGVAPSSWKIIPPAQVDGFNCGGPAVFVQKFSRDVTRKHLFAFFKDFGNIMDIKILELGRKRRRSACVIFSRQSEADKALCGATPRPESRGVLPPPVQIDLVTPPNTFDILLNALRKDGPRDGVGVV